MCVGEFMGLCVCGSLEGDSASVHSLLGVPKYQVCVCKGIGGLHVSISRSGEPQPVYNFCVDLLYVAWVSGHVCAYARGPQVHMSLSVSVFPVSLWMDPCGPRDLPGESCGCERWFYEF